MTEQREKAAAEPPLDCRVRGWQPIITAPKDRSVLLGTLNGLTPLYCGRKRYGQLGEPQQDVFAWRCNSSGRFASPTHWMELPEAPNAELRGATDD